MDFILYSLLLKGLIKLSVNYYSIFITFIIVAVLFLLPIYSDKKEKRIGYVKAREFKITKFVIEFKSKKKSTSDLKLKKKKTLSQNSISNIVNKDFLNEKNKSNNRTSYINYKPNFTVDRIPIYPTAAKRMRQEGNIKLLIITNQNGKILNIITKKSTGYKILDDEAINAVKHWDFLKIISCNDKKNYITTEVDFRLKKYE